MGKSQSKTLRCVSFHTRSASFDSILTSTSYGTEQQYLAHSNSMDSLLHKGHSKSTAVQSKGQLSLRKKKENGRVYNTLIDSESVMGTITYTPPDSDHEFTQSLPDSFKNKYSGDEIDTSIRERSHSQSVTKVSDILLSESKCGDRCDRKSADTTDTFNPELNSLLDDLTRSSLHPSIIEKLSEEEWYRLISYACETLGKSLLTNILEKKQIYISQSSQEQSSAIDQSHKAAETQQQAKPKTLSGKRSHSLEETRGQTSPVNSISNADNGREGGQKLKGKDQMKLERTVSLPPLVSQTGILHSPTDNRNNFSDQTQYRSKNGLLSSRVDSFNHDSRPHRGHGYDHSTRGELFEHERVSDTRQRPKRDKRNSMCSCERKHSSRKKRGRSRSDSVRDQNSLVDPSIDDNCPGVPENRIRRPRHQHQHQHHICKRDVEDLGIVGSNRVGRTNGSGKDWCRHHSLKKEVSNLPVEEPGSAMILTLDDVRMANLLLEKSTEFVEDESPEEERRENEENDLGRFNPNRVHPKKHSNHHDSHFDISDCPNTKVMENGSQFQGRSRLERAEVNGWDDFPASSRSGRDSPATDMAVACLDMNSTRMIEPKHSSEMLVEGGTIRHLYLHNHHHYHHVIHHSQS